MSFQAGVYYADSRPIPDWEAGRILNWVTSNEYPVAASWREEGLFLAHADFGCTNRTACPRQPYATMFGAITFDGRLDNRDDLNLQLTDGLHDQKDDAMLALAVYELRGVDGLAQLIGDWSLAVWDIRRKRLVLASDFAGVRPLYYFSHGPRVLWSTRLRPLARCMQADDLDDEYMAGFLVRGGCPNRTPYRGILSVPPGHYLTASASGIEIHPFWRPPIGNEIRYRRESDYEEHLRDLFRDAVRSRMRTGSPVLSELSGGLDSSSIVCVADHLMREGTAKAPRFVTLTYERQNSLDTRFCTGIEARCGFENVHVSTADHPFLTESHTGDALPAFWEQLHTRVATLAQCLGARTLMTGSLGDLIMGNWWDDSTQILRLLRDGRVLATLRESLAWSKALRIPISWVLWNALTWALPPFLAGSIMEGSSDGPDARRNKEDSIAPTFRARMGLFDKRSFSPQVWAEALPERRKHLRSLGQTLELRKLQPPEPLEHYCYTHPYGHRPLVSYMLSVPADIVCRPGEPRRLMRRAFQGFWPPELRKRRSKDSFGGVFLDSLRPLATALLRKPERLEVVERGYVDRASFTKRLEQLSHSLDCNEGQLRQVILLEYWLRAREEKLRLTRVSNPIFKQNHS